MAMMPAPGGATTVWERALALFEVEGDRFTTRPDAAASLAGTVTFRADRVIAFTVDTPTAGTGFLAVEGNPPVLATSLWLSFYGADAVALADRDGPRWQAWLESLTG